MMRFALLLLLSVLPLWASAKTLQNPAGPDGIEMHWIAQYMEFNDLPMSMRSFSTSLSTEQLRPQIKAYLQTFGDKVQQTSDEEGWTTLATADDERFYSVRFKESGLVTEGVLTVSLREPVDAVQSQLPLGVKRVEKQKFFDGPKIQEFLVLVTASGRAGAFSQAERVLKAEGWVTTRNNQKTRFFVRGHEHATVTVTPGEQGSGSLIFISKELAK